MACLKFTSRKPKAFLKGADWQREREPRALARLAFGPDLAAVRREGIYYGAKNFVRKLAGALAIFSALQVLGWFGYRTPPQGVQQFQQSASALAAIRIMTGPVGALLLVGAIAVAWFYPLTRERHARIRSLLARRRQRQAQATLAPHDEHAG